LALRDNFNLLNSRDNSLHADAQEIFEAGLKAVSPIGCVNRVVSLENSTLRISGTTYDLSRISRIIVIGAGKATPAMAFAIERILDKKITDGLITTKYGHKMPLAHIETVECGHPVPDEEGVIGTQRLLDKVSNLTSDTLVICLFSGGGSALLPAPAQGINLSEKQETTRQLLEAGCTIDEINTIRKHISQIKGGLLAKTAYPAKVVSLILSDVIGDKLATIASGPTCPDNTTYSDSLEIIRRYNLEKQLPIRVYKHIKNRLNNQECETPDHQSHWFDYVQNVVVGNNTIALESASNKARALGYNTLLLTSCLQGEAREAGIVLSSIAQQIRLNGQPVSAPACLLSGGETTVKLKGNGIGGRNQELALSAAIHIENWNNIAILSCGTDGNDGPTDATGAIIDGKTVPNGKSLGHSAQHFLANNDSYSFFSNLNQLIKTGPTGTNVMDIQIALVK